MRGPTPKVIGLLAVAGALANALSAERVVVLDEESRAAALARWIVGIPLSLQGCGSAMAQSHADGRVYRGRAAYYSDKLAGRTTASGEPYVPQKLTAAHRTWPFGTKARVTNLNNDRSVVVRINDRGPFGRSDRIIDLSRRAAEEIRMIEAGVVPVEVRVLSVPDAE